MTYDVAIVGAGPAGSWLARELARGGFTTILFERAANLGEPNFSSAAAPYGVTEEFQLPCQSVAACWTVGKVFGPRSTVTWDFEKPAGVVFDFRALKAGLITEAGKAGAEVRLGTMIKSAQNGSGQVEISTYAGESIRSKLVVDASGSARVLATHFAFVTPKCHPAVGVELVCRTESVPAEVQHTISFYLGRNWAPHGYAWLFPMQKGEIKVGICVYRLKRYANLKLGDVLDRFVASVPWLAGATVIEKHGGFGYLQGGVRQHVAHNMIAIGDAADQINPLAGEGIRHVLHSARFAYRVISRALKTGSVGELQEYDRLWKNYVAHRWRACAIAADLVYRFAPDVLFEFLTRRFGKLTAKEALQVGFDYRSVLLLASMFRVRDRALVELC